MRKPVAEYCKAEMPGWTKIPFAMLPYPEEEEPFVWSFLNEQEAIQLCISTEFGLRQEGFVHASVAPIFSLKPDAPREEIVQKVEEQALEIVEQFCEEGMLFVKMPDAPNHPNNKHFYCWL